MARNPGTVKNVKNPPIKLTVKYIHSNQNLRIILINAVLTIQTWRFSGKIRFQEAKKMAACVCLEERFQVLNCEEGGK